jgi:hypothetical protein
MAVWVGEVSCLRSCRSLPWLPRPVTVTMPSVRHSARCVALRRLDCVRLRGAWRRPIYRRGERGVDLFQLVLNGTMTR